ncbi:MAG: MurR/RpiR family transcriptional regulator [Methylobacteriaceae bacterium]|jgi:DNA-binding MurR/RpiR family transcriptional regulator|nr:MurR/RpiR family transcriptional regulator [Methylobacteriaceae bacterium]
MHDRLEFPDNDDSYLSRIRAKYDTFSKSQKQIARYLSDHPEVILTHSITSLSKKIGTTPPSMTRFCQLIHYKGFADLKFCVEKQISTPFAENLEISLTDSVDTIKNKLIAMDTQAITDTLLLVDDARIRRAAKAICSANNVFIYADGNNSASASYAYHALLQLGISANLFSDYCLGKMAAAGLKENDVAIGITFSGSSSTVLDFMERAIEQGAVSIGITAFANSSLVKMVSIPLCYSAHIGDDLRYLHIARMCEIAIIGLLQSTLINIAPKHMHENMTRSSKAIASFRQR